MRAAYAQPPVVARHPAKFSLRKRAHPPGGWIIERFAAGVIEGRHRPSRVAIALPDVQHETITSVDSSEEAAVIATLVSAFLADPVER